MGPDQVCRACRYYAPEADAAIVGRCRRYPPAIVAVGEWEHEYNTFKLAADQEWPIVSDDDWCGEFVPQSQGIAD